MMKPKPEQTLRSCVFVCLIKLAVRFYSLVPSFFQRASVYVKRCLKVCPLWWKPKRGSERQSDLITSMLGLKGLALSQRKFSVSFFFISRVWCFFLFLVLKSRLPSMCISVQLHSCKDNYESGYPLHYTQHYVQTRACNFSWLLLKLWKKHQLAHMKALFCCNMVEFKSLSLFWGSSVHYKRLHAYYSTSNVASVVLDYNNTAIPLTWISLAEFLIIAKLFI